MAMSCLIRTKAHLPRGHVLLSQNYFLNFTKIVSISSLFFLLKAFILHHQWVHSNLQSFEVTSFFQHIFEIKFIPSNLPLIFPGVLLCIPSCPSFISASAQILSHFPFTSSKEESSFLYAIFSPTTRFLNSLPEQQICKCIQLTTDISYGFHGHLKLTTFKYIQLYMFQIPYFPLVHSSGTFINTIKGTTIHLTSQARKLNILSPSTSSSTYSQSSSPSNKQWNFSTFPHVYYCHSSPL